MKTPKYAWRFLIRSKSYTVINLLGLAFSLACCIMLMRYIHRELTVDTHCIDREHVYGVAREMEGDRHLGYISHAKDSIYIDKRYIDKQTSIILLEKDYVVYDHNPLTFDLFAVAVAITTAISLLTIIGQISKAANINPASIMKNE